MMPLVMVIVCLAGIAVAFLYWALPASESGDNHAEGEERPDDGREERNGDSEMESRLGAGAGHLQVMHERAR